MTSAATGAQAEARPWTALARFFRSEPAPGSSARATGDPQSALERIGTTAGLVWQHLDSSGPTHVDQLIKVLAVPRDVVLQSIGWLAREEKIWLSDTKVISLRR